MPPGQHELVRFTRRKPVSSLPAPRAAIPVRVAVLRNPASKGRGVGPLAVERLLAAWLGSPVVLGHREDGSPLITGAEGHHISLGHAAGCTAIAMAKDPVGIDLAAVAMTSADRRVAASLFTGPERAWLDSLTAAQKPVGFAQLWTLKEALIKRNRQGLDRYELPDVSSVLTDLKPALVGAGTEWRSWAALDVGPSANGLELAMPGATLVPLGENELAVAQLSAAAGRFALAVAWTSGRT